MNGQHEGAAWYEDWFDQDEYEVVYRKRDEEDARRLLALIIRVTGAKQGVNVLDMACGRGRHARLLAQQGFTVTGIDLSPRAIETARATAASEALQITFEVGDMRDARCSACFDLVVNLFTSFGYFEVDSENERAIKAMARALVPGGWMVQDFMNGRYWAKHFVPNDERSEDGVLLKQRRWVEGHRLNKEITLIGVDGASKTFNESVRLYGLEDFERMYDKAGLQIEHVYGDSDGRLYDEESRRLVIFSRRVEMK